MRTLALFAVAGLINQCGWCVEASPRDIVAQSIANYQKDWKAALDFTYTEREISRSASGLPKSVEVSQVNVVDGTPASRLIAKDGHALDAEEARKEADRYQKLIKARDEESREQRLRRIRKYEEERQFLYEIPDAFNMKLLGHETLNGRPNFMIKLTPKPGYVPKSRNARLFSSIEGTLWIDEQDVRWTKAVAEVVDPISFGWVLARIGPGAHITMKQVRIDGETWMPKEIDVNGVARIMLVKNRTINETISFENYKRVRPAPGSVAAKNR